MQRDIKCDLKIALGLRTKRIKPGNNRGLEVFFFTFKKIFKYGRMKRLNIAVIDMFGWRILVTFFSVLTSMLEAVYNNNS